MLYGRLEDQLDSGNARHLSRLAGLLKYTFATGGWRGARTSSLQFLAEHQHALPGIRTRAEASAYLRLRNARVVLGAGYEGVRRGIQLSTVAAVFGGVKWTVALARQRNLNVGNADELIAGLATGALFTLGGSSLRQRLFYLRRGLLMGGLFGAALLSLRLVLERYSTGGVNDDRSRADEHRIT